MTTQNELEILTNYDRMLRKRVHGFMNRCSVRTVSAEDLMQEARIAFLKHIRTHEPEEYGRCRLTILHALCDAVLRQYPLSMPQAVYFDAEKRPPLFMVDYDSMAEALAFKDDHTAVELVNEIMNAVERFPKEAMELVRLKLEGYSNREAAQELGMTDVQVSRTLSRIRRLLDDAA